jgi:hypothetical protein
MTSGMGYFSWGPLEGQKSVLPTDYRYLADHGALIFNMETRTYHMEKFIGGVYMALLAKYIGRLQNLPIVTDDFDHHVLLNCDMLKFEQEFDGSKEDLQEIILCNLTLDAIGIKDLSKVSVDSIVQIRKKYDNERVEFVNRAEQILKNLPREEIKNEEQLKLYLQDEAHKLKRKLLDFENAIRGEGIETVFDIAKVSLSLPVGEFLSKHMALSEPLMIGLSGAIGVGALIYKAHNKRKAAKLKDPSICYLHQISQHLSRNEYFDRFKEGISNIMIA